MNQAWHLGHGEMLAGPVVSGILSTRKSSIRAVEQDYTRPARTLRDCGPWRCVRDDSTALILNQKRFW